MGGFWRDALRPTLRTWPGITCTLLSFLSVWLPLNECAPITNHVRLIGCVSTTLSAHPLFIGRLVHYFLPCTEKTILTERELTMAANNDYRSYLRNPNDIEGGQPRFHHAQTSEPTYRPLLFGTLAVMGLLQVASSVAILLHLTGYLHEVRHVKIPL